MSDDRSGGTENTIKHFIKKMKKVDFTQGEEAIKKLLRLVKWQKRKKTIGGKDLSSGLKKRQKRSHLNVEGVVVNDSR